MSGVIGSLYPQANIYENDKASIFAFAHPVIIFFIYIYIFHVMSASASASARDRKILFFYKNTIKYVFSFSVGLMPIYVTASFRFFEILLVLLSYILFLAYKNNVKNLLFIFLFIGYLSFFNVQRNTWIQFFTDKYLI